MADEASDKAFIEWRKKKGDKDELGRLWTLDNMAYDAWQAATFAANSKLGDEGNEGAKDARRKVAVQKMMYSTFAGLPSEVAGQIDAIIKEAQG